MGDQETLAPHLSTSHCSSLQQPRGDCLWVLAMQVVAGTSKHVCTAANTVLDSILSNNSNTVPVLQVHAVTWRCTEYIITNLQTESEFIFFFIFQFSVTVKINYMKQTTYATINSSRVNDASANPGKSRITVSCQQQNTA